MNVINEDVSASYNDLSYIVLTGFSANTYPDITISFQHHIDNYLHYEKAIDLTPFIYNPDFGFKEEYENDFLKVIRMSLLII